MQSLKLTAVAAVLCVTAAADAVAESRCGGASWYAMTSRTASGERMDPAQMTAAHRKLPFGTKLRVTNSRNGKSAIVRVNDRGPFVRGRMLDLSKAAATQLGFIRAGHAKVCFEVIGRAP